MTTIDDVLADLPAELAKAMAVQNYQIGNRSVTRQRITDLVDAYLKLQAASEASGAMCSLGRMIPNS